MNAEQFERERQYSAALAMAQGMLAEGLMTPKEYEELREIFVQKYLPVIGGL